MRNLTVKQTLHVVCSASADQWQLYDKPDRDYAAILLNAAFSGAVNAGKDAHEIRSRMDKVMAEWSHVGANDTEGRDMVERLIEATFKGAR